MNCAKKSALCRRRIRIWRWILLPATISICFAQAPVTEGLENRWSGDGSARDLAGHDDGTVSGGLKYTEGQGGKAFQFNGTDSSISFGTTAGNFGAKDFTVAYWMKTSSKNQNEAFLEKRRTCDAATPLWEIHVGGQAAGYLTLELNNGAYQYSHALVSSHAVNDGVWHHVAWVRQTTSSGSAAYLLYVDGKLDSNANHYLGGRLDNSINFLPPTDVSNNNALLMGQGVCECCDGTRPYSGAAGELQIFSHGLSAEEISAIYEATKARNQPIPEKH